MDRLIPNSLAACLLTAATAVCAGDGPKPANAIVIGPNKNLVAGAEAIRSGHYATGIRLTLRGLQSKQISSFDRAAGLANLCSAYVAERQPDKAIPYCDRSLRLNRSNWRTYSARSQAYLIKGDYFKATLDNDAAAALSPNAPHVRMIRGLINEHTLKPQVTVQEHP